MITGFITTANVAAQIEAGITEAFTSRDLPQFWSLGSMPILSGIYAGPGMTFIPADDLILSTPLRGNPPMMPIDFPEFAELVELLGGLEARREIDPADITPTTILGTE